MERKFYKIEAKKNTRTKINVAAYARVSTTEDSQLNSLSQQISYYNELIQHNPQWNFVKIYVDRGISGTKTKNRDGINELIKDAKAGNIDLILTKSISRFARNTVELLKIVRDLKKINVEIQFEKERLSTLSKEGDLMLSLLAGFAQQESQSISENIKWGIRKSYEKGIIRKQRTYGFDIINNEFKINLKESKVVKFIFDSFLSGKCHAEIADLLNERGIPSSRNGKWSRMIIKKILKNEKYAGFTILQKSYVKDPITKSQKVNNNELPMYQVSDTNEAIVTVDEFERVQELIKTANDRVNRWQKRRTWITGLVKCPVCGGTMSYKKRDNKLRCSNHDKRKCPCSNSKGLNYNLVIESINKAFKLKKFDEKVVNKIKKIVGDDKNIKIVFA